MEPASNTVTALLNELLGAYWSALAQHRTHVALIESWGISGLARTMETHIADEPVTLQDLLSRLLDLGGQPNFTLTTPRFGSNVREVLTIDMEAQRRAAPGLNAAAEQAAAAHDATTRALIERILADEERHLSWLDTEITLLDLIGEPLYVASRLTLQPTATP